MIASRGAGLDAWHDVRLYGPSKTSALECTWVKLYDLYRDLNSTGPVWFERPARCTRAYSRLPIPSARNQNPSNEGGGLWARPGKARRRCRQAELRIRGQAPYLPAVCPGQGATMEET
jgi:hypothetical protein